MKSYSFPADLVQAIVSLLGGMPAAQTRLVLNGIEQHIIEQDKVDSAAKPPRKPRIKRVKPGLAPAKT